MPDEQTQESEALQVEEPEVQVKEQPQEPLHPIEQAVVDAESNIEKANLQAVDARKALMEHLKGKNVRVYTLQGDSLAICDPDEVEKRFNTGRYEVDDIPEDQRVQHIEYLHEFVTKANKIIARLLENKAT